MRFPNNPTALTALSILRGKRGPWQTLFAKGTLLQSPLDKCHYACYVRPRFLTERNKRTDAVGSLLNPFKMETSSILGTNVVGSYI